MSFSWKKLDKAKALEATLDTALKVLETTENVLNTTPIPGAAAVISLILEVVKRQDRASSNAKRSVEQQERWKKLVSQLEECETDPDSTPHDALSNLREASQTLASELKDYARELKEATTHEFRPRWMTCTGDEEALQDFLRKSNEAIADFQYAQGRRIEECVMKIHGIVGAMNTTVNQISVSVQAERDESKFKEFDRLIETRRAPLAAYNAPRTVGTVSSCSEGTRTPLLKTISDWIKDPDADKVFWLKERAGFGKTAIALSVAEQAAEERMLAASFFFSYQIPDLSNTFRFLPTIIHQLCLFGGVPCKQHFAAVITDHPDLLDAKLKHQAQKLFLNPLNNSTLAPADKPIVIVIDALDECLHEDAQDLTAFIASLSPLHLPLKIFITSRPESQITAPFSDLGVRPRAIVDTSNEDVETYLRAELAKIPSKPSIRDLNLPRDWIKEEDIQVLLERAGAKGVKSDSTDAEKGLFVYIATVVRFVGDTRRCNPPKLLGIVLSTTPPQPSYRPFQALDDLYTRVLNVALGGAEDLLQQFHAVVGGVMAMEADSWDLQPISTLEKLLDLPQGEVRRTLVNLQSVVQYPDTDSTLPSFYHRSFTDFLTSKDRSGSGYFIDLKLHKKRFALGCLRVIATSSLKVEVLKAMNKEDYFVYPQTDSSPEFWHVNPSLPAYYWDTQGDKEIMEYVERFIRDDFGWWIEVLFCRVGSRGRYSENYHKISDAVDPQGERELPVVFRALVWTDRKLRLVEREIHAPALMRKELRRYVSAVKQRQDGQSSMGTEAMTMSIRKHIYKLRDTLDRFPDDTKAEEICVAVLAFAKEAEAAVNEYQLSIGCQEEVESSRRRTIFLRRQIKPLIVQNGWITDDEPFEQKGIWTLSVAGGNQIDSNSDSV